MEAPVSVSLGVVLSLPAKLGRLLSPEAGNGLRKGERNQIRRLKDQLQELIDKYLMEPSEVDAPAAWTARCWVKEVRELSYDIDDFLDELIHRLHGGGAAAAANQKNLQGKVAKLREGLTRSRWVADETSRFRASLEEAIQRHKRYNLDKLQSRPNRIDTEDEDEPSIRVKAACLVGIDSSMKKLEEWLTGDGERRLRVVSIVGFGGIGKTTLAQELYCKLGWQFECRAFARSSHKPDIRRLLTSILLQIRRYRLPNDLELGNLTDTIRTYLQDKKYFIIIDDLWDASLWDIIHRALPDDKCCSRVLTTTEIDILAQRCCGHSSKHIFNMEPLCDKGSSELFFSRFSVNQSGNCEEFNKVLSEIIRKCGGFPLATIATASILARQQGKIEHYNLISRSLSMNLRTNPTIEGMEKVLSLCYDNLPGRLKACMLYLSIYKEGQTIWKTDLLKQWITEGFICEKQGKHMEEVAGSYFDELINAGMIQPVDIKCNGEVLSCTVHYMVLNVIRYKSIEENFVTAIDYSQTNTSLADKVRRLSLHFGDVDDVESPAKLRMTQVRSLVFYGFFRSLPSIIEFRFLRVLIIHLWGDRDSISLDLTTVCNFFRLTNLNIACNVTLNLQIKLQGLEYLEILKIDSRVTEVPQEIVLLPSLLHLSLPGDTNLPNGIGHMASLHTLGCFDLSSNSADNVRSLGVLCNVRDLHLTCSTIQCDSLLDNVGCLASVLSKLSNLKSLNLSPVVCSSANTLEASAPSNIISFDGLSRVSSPPALLEQIEFSPRICIFSRLPQWIGELGKLSVIKVATWELRQSDIDILSRLNALSALSLYVRTAPAERIIFHKGGFAILIYFKFTCSSPCLSFKKEAMPNVRRLKIGLSAKTLEQCSRDVVGAGFENLTGLKVLSVKIVGAGCDESVRETVQSALEHAFGKREGNPIINVQLVDRIFYGDREMNVVVQKEQRQTLEKSDVITETDLEGQCRIGELGLTEDTKTRDDDRSRITLSLESSAQTENPGRTEATSSTRLKTSWLGQARWHALMTRTIDRLRSNEPIGAANLGDECSSNAIPGSRLRCAQDLAAHRYPGATGRVISRAANNVQVFSLSELKTATRNFHMLNCIGRGGFGAVYKGNLKDGTQIAIKKLSAESKQGISEFLTEINVISNVRHPNLIKLIGCCVEGNNRLLVYEYAENNSLANALLGSKNKCIPLDWQKRAAICIGTASGLAFLHEEAQPCIVHRDIKASNILLDKKLLPKIGNLGLAKLFPDTLTHISTRVAGTMGYLAPEYALLGQLTRKADVYSFGVLLLEVISGQSSSKSTWGPDMFVLVEWTWKLREEGRLLEIVDPELEDYPEEQMLRFIKVALLCTQATFRQRPSMKQVVNMLSNQTEIDLQNVVPPGVLKEPHQRTGGFGGLTVDTSSSQSTKCNPAESYSTQTNMNSVQFSTTDVSPR